MLAEFAWLFWDALKVMGNIQNTLAVLTIIKRVTDLTLAWPVKLVLELPDRTEFSIFWKNGG